LRREAVRHGRAAGPHRCGDAPGGPVGGAAGRGDGRSADHRPGRAPGHLRRHRDLVDPQGVRPAGRARPPGRRGGHPRPAARRRVADHVGGQSAHRGGTRRVAAREAGRSGAGADRPRGRLPVAHGPLTMRYRLVATYLILLTLVLLALEIPLAVNVAASRTQAVVIDRNADAARLASLADPALRTGETQTLIDELDRYYDLFGITAAVADRDGRLVASTGDRRCSAPRRGAAGSTRRRPASGSAPAAPPGPGG